MVHICPQGLNNNVQSSHLYVCLPTYIINNLTNLLILFIDDITSFEFLEIIPLSTVNRDYIYAKIKWESTPFSVVDVVTIQPPPLCGPTNITNSAVMACLERNGNIIYNISIHQRSCSRIIKTSFSLDCPLMLDVVVMRIIFYTNGTTTALNNANEIITCDNGVWPNADTICKKDNFYVII